MEPTAQLTGDFEQIQVLRDPAAGVLAFLAVHNTRLGPAFGGIRRLTYATVGEALADALRLAEAMTWKCAVSGVPGGGAKTVLVQTPELDRRAAYRLIGSYVEQMGGRYYAGPDVGTDADDLEEVATRTRYVARAGAEGPGNLAESTALGVFAGIGAVARRLGFAGVEDAHVVVQGLGEVGLRLARRLRDAGARLILSDVRRDHAEEVAAELDGELVEADAVLDVEADVLAPCALGGVVDANALTRLRVRAIAGSANNVLVAPEHGDELFRRGVLYAPDFVVNSGGLLQGALFHLEGSPPPPERILAIGERLDEIFDRSRELGEPPERIAMRIARERVAAAERDQPFWPEQR